MLYLTYVILLLCGNASDEYIKKLFKLQKRVLRIVSNTSYMCLTKRLFDTLNIFEFYNNNLNMSMYNVQV